MITIDHGMWNCFLGKGCEHRLEILKKIIFNEKPLFDLEEIEKKESK